MEVGSARYAPGAGRAGHGPGAGRAGFMPGAGRARSLPGAGDTGWLRKRNIHFLDIIFLISSKMNKVDTNRIGADRTHL